MKKKIFAEKDRTIKRIQDEESIVRPIKPKSVSKPPSTAAMVSSQSDLLLLCRSSGLDPDAFKNLFAGRLYLTEAPSGAFCMVGPVIGAPYAVMLLENLAAWGVNSILFLGWCGAVSAGVEIGDIIVPDGAYIDEGTSRHYRVDDRAVAYPSLRLAAKTIKALEASGIDYRVGAVWTTDAIYRETRSKVEMFQKKGALAVEMELSALFTVGIYLGVEVSGVLLVSDDVSTFTWRPGFQNERFRKSRKALAEVFVELCRSL